MVFLSAQRLFQIYGTIERKETVSNFTRLSFIQLYWNVIDSASTNITWILIFFWVDRIRKRTNRFTAKVLYVACYQISYIHIEPFSRYRHLKKLFFDDRTGEQTNSSSPNFLCDHFRKQIINVPNLKSLDLTDLKISRYREFLSRWKYRSKPKISCMQYNPYFTAVTISR